MSGFAPLAAAATITVDNAGAGSVANACPLADAVVSAHGDAAAPGSACAAGSGADTIAFAPGIDAITAAAPVTASVSALVVTQPLTIEIPSQTSLTGGASLPMAGIATGWRNCEGNHHGVIQMLRWQLAATHTGKTMMSANSIFRALRFAALLAAFGTPNAFADVPASEHDVLVSLYSGAGGSGWTNRTHWNTSDPICPGSGGENWYGISCDDTNSHVTAIQLPTNGLSGSLPAGLNGLTSLTFVDVSANQLSGPIPSLDGLADLSTFNARDNQLSGPAPDLASLSNLNTFNVGTFYFTADGTWPTTPHNRLTGSIPALTGLRNLQIFNVTGNELTGSIPELTGLANLEQFSATGNQLTGSIPALDGSPGLTSFGVNYNQLTGTIPNLTALTSLSGFYVDHNQLGGPPPAPPSSNTSGQALQAGLCPNQLQPIPSTFWDQATNITPWYRDCTSVSTTPTTTTLVASADPANLGQVVTFTATVTAASPDEGEGTRTAAAQPQGASPTGTVRFSEGGATLADVALNGGSAVYSTASLSAGTHTITGTYLGDSLYAGSSASANVTVNAVAPPAAPVPAPTLSTWTLILFGLILAVCAAVALQRLQRGR